MFQESLYTEEQTLIAAFASQLSKQYDDLYFLKETKQGSYPSAFWQELSQGGYLGLLVSEEHGGVGLKAQDLVVFVHAMAKAGLVSYQLINQLLCSDILDKFGSAQQIDSVLPKVVEGDFCCYADLEHTQGRSLFDIAMIAETDGDNFILNGKKSFAVCAQMASHIIVAARTAGFDKANPESGLSLFLVDANNPGIEFSTEHLSVRIDTKREEMAATGDVFNNIIFKDVKVPATSLIGELDKAGDYIPCIASRQMLMVSLMSIGWGDRLIDKTIDYANDRVIFKDPISSYQAVQHPLVLAKTEVEMAKLLTERAAEAFDESVDVDELLSYCGVAKARATEAVYKACDIATQTHGGSGYDRDTGIISLWPLILVSRRVPLNSKVIMGRFAEKVLGMPGDEKSSDLQKLMFESRTEREVKLMGLAREAFAENAAAAETAEKAKAAGKDVPENNAAATMMMRVMAGDLSEYRDMIMSDGEGMLPVKLDIFRQLAFHLSEDASMEGSMARSLAERSPVKFGLSAMAMAAISSGKGGTQKVMSEYVPQMMKGKLFCYCITEPGAGTNTHKVSTTAVDKGDHFLLSGQKTYISAADSAYFMAVVARVEVDGQKEQIGTFVLDAKLDGISMTELDIAALGDPQFTVYFDNVILPKDALVGAKSATSSAGNKGISDGVFYTLNLERVMVALGAMKVGEEALNKAVAKAKEEQPFGPLLGASDSVKEQLASLRLDFELTNLALKKATVAFDAKDDPKRVGMFANMAKYLSSEFAHEAADLALELYGVEGLDKDADNIGGLCKLGRVLRTVPINNEMVLNFLAENLMGLPKSYRV